MKKIYIYFFFKQKPEEKKLEISVTSLVADLAETPALPRSEKERRGSYLFPPLQLTKDPFEALVHVVKLGRRKKRCRYSAAATTGAPVYRALPQTRVFTVSILSVPAPVWPKTTPTADKNDSQHIGAHIWSENLDPARFLLPPDVFKAERHSFLVCVPALHLPPVKGNDLVLNGTQSILMNRKKVIIVTIKTGNDTTK